MAPRLLCFAAFFALGPLGGCGAEPSRADPSAPLVLERTIPLAGVRGRIDHMALDEAHRRLFVAELGNGSLEAIDLASGASLGRVGGLKEPQGVVYLPDRDEVVSAAGGDGFARFYRAADLGLLGAVAIGDDADNIRIDPRSGHVIIGYGEGALAVVDPAARRVLARIALPGHPESFQIEGGRVFVNVPDAHRIVVADLADGRIVASWPTRHGWNFPMIMIGDALAVAYRLPARLQVLDNRTGAVRSDIAVCGDSDDIFSDPGRRRLYVVCGSGAVDVVDMAPGRLAASIDTRSGARTGAWSPALDRLFVAARAGAAGEGAALLVFKPRS